MLFQNFVLVTLYYQEMLQKSLLNFFILPFSLIPFIFNSQASALPGQTTEEVNTWIQAHPTLTPRRGENLFVQKSDTAAQRFTFQASVLPPGRVQFSQDRSKIRNERIAMYGWLLNTGIKLVIIVDMEGRPAEPGRITSALGLRNSDMTPVSSITQ